MERLLKKFETAKSYVPAPQIYNAENNADYRNYILRNIHPIMLKKRLTLLKEKRIHLDALRIKSFPFNQTVEDFIDAHDKVFVVEQNRDAQLRSLMLIELGGLILKNWFLFLITKACLLQPM